jgi:hypothetical protein
VTLLSSASSLLKLAGRATDSLLGIGTDVDVPRLSDFRNIPDWICAWTGNGVRVFGSAFRGVQFCDPLGRKVFDLRWHQDTLGHLAALRCRTPRVKVVDPSLVARSERPLGVVEFSLVLKDLRRRGCECLFRCTSLKTSKIVLSFIIYNSFTVR